MNEQLISDYEPQVRNEFEQHLRIRLENIERQQKHQRKVLTIITIFTVLISSAWFIPPIQAQLRWWVKEIAGFTFVEIENPRENWETVYEVLPTSTPEPQAIEGEYLIEEIMEDLPFVLDGPTWVPEGYDVDPFVTVSQNDAQPQVTVTWRKGDEASIVFEARRLSTSEDVSDWEVDSTEVTSVEKFAIHEHTARFVQYTHPENGLSWSLLWREANPDNGNIEYRLSSNDVGIPYDELQRMTNTTGHSAILLNRKSETINQAMSNLSYEWLVQTYPDMQLDDFLPVWLPKGWAMEDSFSVSSSYPGAGFLWRNHEQATEFDTPWFSMAVWPPNWDNPIIMEPDNVQKIKVGKQTGALWVVFWISPTEDNPGDLYELAWKHNGLTYAICWNEVDLTLDEVIRIAESIPDADVEIDPYELHRQVRREILLNQP